jgi:hypothetical protein
VTITRRLTLGVVTLIALSVTPAWAGHPQERRGFWIGFGFGYGSAGLGCDDCDFDEREGAFTGYVKLGGTLSERLLLGLETNAWIEQEGTSTLTLGSMTGTVTFYPRASSGFFLKAGAGASYIDMEDRFGDVAVSVDKVGWGVLAGIGYDVRVGRNVSITPSVNYYYGQPGDLDFGGELVRGLSQDVVEFVVGVTFH